MGPETICLREERYAEGTPVGDGTRTESVAVGSMKFAEQTKKRLGIRAWGEMLWKPETRLNFGNPV